MTTLYIKNMVCDRCKAAVKNALQSLGLKPVSVELGIADIEGEIDKDKTDEIRTTLCDLGFELLEDKQKQIIDRIKSEIIELVHYKDNKSDVNLSTHLSGKLATDYSTLSKLFSESTGMTIERYVILQKIERVKELLRRDVGQRNSIEDELFKHGIPEHPVQERNGHDAFTIQGGGKEKP